MANVHIGKIIKKLISERNLSVKEVVEYMNMSESNLYDIYKRTSVDVDKLGKFSMLLTFNLFKYYLPKDDIEKIFAQNKDQNDPAAEKDIFAAKTIAEQKEIIKYLTKLLAIYEQKLNECGKSL